ncbi:hypothetical protein BC629DRAFT_281440 [Irpex lacteus]|nr:hypothetical protein BC629DRAFT_281440 [Irpex lacteus]
MSMTTLHDLSWIGDKYAMEPLLAHVYHKLELIFPVDCLADWVSLHEGMQEADVIPNGSERADLLYSIHMIRMWHPRAVNMLPVIYYFYCQLPLQEICLPDTTEPLRLGPEDVERCLQAIPRLFKRKIGLYSTFAVFLSGRVPRICTNEDKNICDRVLALLSNDVMSRDNIAKLPDALEDLEKWCFLRPEWSQLCACCSQEVTHIIWRHRVDT